MSRGGFGAFVLDEYNAYGEVPVPGEGTVHLPAGDVNIGFHSQIAGSTNGGVRRFRILS